MTLDKIDAIGQVPCFVGFQASLKLTNLANFVVSDSFDGTRIVFSTSERQTRSKRTPA